MIYNNVRLSRCTIAQIKRVNSWGSCHINIREPVGYLMPFWKHPLFLPHISGIMFSIFPQQHCLSWQSACPRRHKSKGQLEKDHSSDSVRWKIWKSGSGWTDRCVFPLFQQAATVWLTNWLLRGLCPFQSEFIEGDFDLLYEATAAVLPSVTLIAWRSL